MMSQDEIAERIRRDGRMMSPDEIFEEIGKDGERLAALGVSKERQDKYYSELSTESADPDQDQEAFANATSGLNLSVDDLAFVKKVLDSGDGR